MTAGGGLYPTWRGDGSELYYLTLDGKLMALPVKEEGDHLDPSKPTPLFQSPLPFKVLGAGPNDLYDASANGKRFVFM